MTNEEVLISLQRLIARFDDFLVEVEEEIRSLEDKTRVQL